MGRTTSDASARRPISDHPHACGENFRGVVPTNTEGFFFPVTLLDNPPDGAGFVTQEVFGPIRSILKYRNLDEAIRRANDSSYGLGASVWGSDPVQLRSVAGRLEAGTVWINQHAIRNPFVPASAYKDSGLGVEFGQEGLEEFCNMQVIAERAGEKTESRS